MTATRRVLILIGLTLAVTIGAAIPASATFADSVTATTGITTGTVAAPTGVSVTDSCITTTTTVRRTTRYDSATGVTTQISYSSSSSSTTSTFNDQGSTTTTTSAPGPTPTTTDTTTTTVTKNTNLHVTLSWTASQSRGVNGYIVSAHLGAYNQVAPLLGTTATSISAVEDADQLALGPSLIVTTSTTYGWTADAPRTRVLSC